MAVIHAKKIFKHNHTFRQLVDVMKRKKGGIAEVDKNLILRDLLCPPYEFVSTFKRYVQDEYPRGTTERNALLFTFIVIQENMKNDTIRIVFKNSDHQDVMNLPVIKILTKLGFRMGFRRGWFNNAR